MRIKIDQEYHPPSEEHSQSQEFAPLGDEYNADAADPPRRVRKRRWTSCVVAAAVTVALLSGAVASSWESPAPSAAATTPPISQPPAATASQPPTESTEPAPLPSQTAETEQFLLTLAEAAERYPYWYDESKDIWLHFEGNEGWFSDGQFFHRFTWRATGNTSGVSTMSFCDIGSGYNFSGSTSEPVDSPMTLLNESGGCRLMAASGMGEGIIGSSASYETPELTLNSFVPAEEPGVDGSDMEGILGKTTEELLTGVARFAASEQASDPFGGAGLNTALSAGMTELYFVPDGSGSMSYDDGTVAPITWSVNGDHSSAVCISYEDVTFSDGIARMAVITGGLTFTEDGPYLWFYNPFTNMETCFAPE